VCELVHEKNRHHNEKLQEVYQSRPAAAGAHYQPSQGTFEYSRLGTVRVLSHKGGSKGTVPTKLCYYLVP
jgi:hypothetical protein